MMTNAEGSRWFWCCPKCGDTVSTTVEGALAAKIGDHKVTHNNDRIPHENPPLRYAVVERFRGKDAVTIAHFLDSYDAQIFGTVMARFDLQSEYTFSIEIVDFPAQSE